MAAVVARLPGAAASSQGVLVPLPRAERLSRYNGFSFFLPNEVVFFFFPVKERRDAYSPVTESPRVPVTGRFCCRLHGACGAVILVKVC